MPEGADWFEVRDELHCYYGYSYGGVSPFFREIVENRRLLAARCGQCGRLYCPPHPDCPRCWERTVWEEHTGVGAVVAPVYCYWTQIGSAVRKYVQPPFVYALVRLDGAANDLHTLIHTDDSRVNRTVHVGTRVRVCFREEPRGSIADLYFVPVGEEPCPTPTTDR